MSKPERQSVSFGYQEVSPKEKDRLVRDHFTAIAAKYDVMNTMLSFGLHHLWKRKAVAMMSLKPGDKVLDVCGGTADLAMIAARIIGPGGRIRVYDINHAMMKAGREKIGGSAEGNIITFVEGDAERISFPDNTFDGVMVGFGVRNLTFMERGLTEMCRVLKPGGTYMCLEFSRPSNRLFGLLYDFYSFAIMPAAGKIFAGSRKAYTYLPESIRVFPSPERLSEIMENAGFSTVTFKRLTNGIAVIHRATKS